MMKYAIVTTVSSTMGSFGIPLAKELKNQGNEPVVICNMTEAFFYEYRDSFRCINLDIARGFHMVNLIKTIFKLYKIFKSEKFDIVQYGTENAAFCGAIASWMAKVPIRVYEHWGARYVGYAGFMRMVSKMIEKTAAFFSTDVRQVSFRNMEMCVRDHIYSEKKVRVLGKGGTVGVDFQQFDLSHKQEFRLQVLEQYDIPSDAKIFGFVGRIQTDKGVNELIDAFYKLYEQDKMVYLLMVGAVDDANPIDAKKLEWAQQCQNVIFTGFVSDAYRYMSAFDIMVHPTYREGFGMVLQEAAALKIPIITTNINGPGEYILHGETGILVSAKDEEQLYHAMRELLVDVTQREILAEKNYQYTKDYFERSIMVQRIIEDRKQLLYDRGGTQCH